MNKIENWFLDCGMQRKKWVMGNVIVHVVNAGALRGEDYWSQHPQKHCREHGHAEGGNEYRPFVSLAL